MCNITLTFEDIDTNSLVTLESSDIVIARTNITISTQQLARNRRYSVSVTASNVRGQTVAETIISKPDGKSVGEGCCVRVYPLEMGNHKFLRCPSCLLHATSYESHNFLMQVLMM